MVRTVVLSKAAQKQVAKAPEQVARKLATWVATVQLIGLQETRKVPGYHDEPLQGDRAGQRSIRLNLQWRAIYRVVNGEVECALVEEVTPHKY